MSKFVILLVFFGFMWSGESRIPESTLPGNPSYKYYQGFQKIRSTRQTADKLKKNYIAARQAKDKLEDTVIVMDGSGSVGSCEFNIGKRALIDFLVRMGNVGGGFDSKFACVTFSSSAKIDFNFLPPTKAARKITSSVHYPGGGSNMQLGLLYAKLLMRGSRKNSEKMVFLVTDGQSNVNSHKTVHIAKALKNDGVKIFVVAVGSYINGIDEMVKVASYPPEKYLFRVKNLSNFLKIATLVVKKVSPGKYRVIQRQQNSLC